VLGRFTKLNIKFFSHIKAKIILVENQGGLSTPSPPNTHTQTNELAVAKTKAGPAYANNQHGVS